MRKFSHLVLVLLALAAAGELPVAQAASPGNWTNSYGDAFTQQWADNFVADTNLNTTLWGIGSSLGTLTFSNGLNLTIPVGSGTGAGAGIHSQIWTKFGGYVTTMSASCFPGDNQGTYLVRAVSPQIDWNEIDMELMAWNGPTYTLHWGDYEYSKGIHDGSVTNGTYQWKIEWTPNYISWYRDSVLRYTLTNSSSSAGWTIATGTGVEAQLFSQRWDFSNWLPSGILHPELLPNTLTVKDAAYYALDMQSFSATNFSAASGFAVGTDAKGRPMDECSGVAGAYLRYDNIDPKYRNLAVDLACGSNAMTIEVRTNSPTGPVIATIYMPVTGSWSNYTMVCVNLPARAQAQSLYLTMPSAANGYAGRIYNVHFFGTQPSSGPSGPSSPAVQVQPTNQTVYAGQTATFNVTANGWPLLGYQWQSNNVPIAGGTNATYTPPATTLANNGTGFRVIITNAYGSITSSVATLTVVAVTSPVIQVQPANQTVFVGQPATFNVTASGGPVFGYQWQSNSVPVAGGTNATYTTPATTLAGSGTGLRVIITNYLGSITSRVATLTVVAGANRLVWDSFTNTNVHPISSSIDGQAPEIGSGLWVSAKGSLKDSTSGLCTGTLTGGNPQGEIAIPSIVLPSATMPVTVQAEVFPTNFNSWVALGFQIAPDDGYSWYLETNLLWVYVNYPGQNITVRAGTASVKSVNTTVAPGFLLALTYDPATQNYLVQADGGTVASGTKAIANTIGSAGLLGNTPKAAGLQGFRNFGVARVPAVITQQPVARTVDAGQTAQFTVALWENSPTPSYQWQIFTNGTYVNLSNGGNLSGATTPTLTINNVAAGGQYAVVISNSYGTLMSRGALLALTPKTNAYLTSLILNPAGVLTPAFTTNGFNYWATNSYGATPTVTVTNADPTAMSVLIYNGTPLQVLTSGVPSQPLTLNVGVTNVVQVLVTAQDGVTTNVYTVKVIELLPPIPFIVVQPTNQTEFAGQTATFSVTVDGVPPLRYQWQSNSVPVAGGTNATYTTPITTLADNGTGFRVMITNAFGSVTSSVATLTVVPDPNRLVWDSFTNTTVHPISSSINGQAPEHGSGTWVSAKGSLLDSTSGLCAGMLGGGNPQGEIGIPSIVLPSATMPVTVQAEVFPTNYTSWVALGFQIAPDTGGGWFGSSNLLWVRAGYSGNITVQAGTVTVKTVNTNVAPGFLLALTYDPATSNYLVQADGATVASGIRAITNIIGSAGLNGNAPKASGVPGFRNFAVARVPAVITQQPLAQTVDAGQTAQFTVALWENSPTPSYQWQVFTNGTYVNVSNGGNLSGATTPTLTISNALAGAQYAVVINNSYGSLLSRSAPLTVIAGTNAYLTSLVLNPAGVLTPAFTTTGFNYWATNSYGATPTVTVTNADPTAMSGLIYNGTPLQVLTSGVPSQALTLSVGMTNVVQVLVTAQDGVTTNVYTVKVIAPSPPIPYLTNSWNGSSLTLSWPAGATLLQATNVVGPWTTNAGTSPLNVTPTQPQQFFRVIR